MTKTYIGENDMILPSDFIEELGRVLGDDTEKYISLYDKPAFRGISVNRLKTTPEKLLPLLPFEAVSSPFYKDGYYIPSDWENGGNHPLHLAGGYYIQEPSASSAAELLDISPGDKVLDMCAAPGGKSSQIASMLGGSGLIWSNEVVKNRASVLISNYERMGISNGIVSSCYPDRLAEKLEGYFDKVLVDAPCSGEGMFRKNPEAVGEWSRAHVTACAQRQLSILKCAVKCLREGGILVYSTCTFSPEENEETVEKLLSECPELEPYDITETAARKTSLPNAIRITPIEGGEGHFAARFRKKEESDFPSVRPGRISPPPKEIRSLADKLLGEVFSDAPERELNYIGERLYLAPEEMPELNGLGVLRAGVLVGETVKKRIEPAHALFMSFPVEKYNNILELSLDDSRLEEYLSGLETDCGEVRGYTLVSVEGLSLGFGKASGGRLKNKYPKGLRRK